MKRSHKIYNVFHKGSALFMILALCWLTISTPFVFACQQEMAKLKMEDSRGPLNAQEDESNPLGNNTEEKVPGSANSLSEEYLHDHHITQPYLFSETSQYHKCENADTYIAFHGELLVPPPNAA